MATSDDMTLALRLQEARESLEEQIRTAVRAYEVRTTGPVEFTMSLTNGEAQGNESGDDELRGTVRNLVEAFLAQEVVRETGVQIRRVTALDSDRDGKVAVNVKYDYRM